MLPLDPDGSAAERQPSDPDMPATVYDGPPPTGLVDEPILTPVLRPGGAVGARWAGDQRNPRAMLPHDPDDSAAARQPSDSDVPVIEGDGPPPTGLVDQPILTPVLRTPGERRRGWPLAVALVLVTVMGGGALFLSGYTIGRDQGRTRAALRGFALERLRQLLRAERIDRRFLRVGMPDLHANAPGSK